MTNTPIHQRAARLLAALLLVLPAACAYGASFGGLGDLSGGNVESRAYDVSADGSVVVGSAFSTSGREAFRWTSATSMVGLGDLTGGTFDSYATGVSGDGLTIVGGSDGSSGREAFRWTSATGMTGLGDLAGGSFSSVAYGASSDGSTIVGSGVTTAGLGEIGGRAVRWISGGTPVAIGNIDYAQATAVSGDGLTIVGSQSSRPWNEAFRWTLATGIVVIERTPDNLISFSATAISTDGSVIVGFGYHADNGTASEAFRWTQATGMVGIGNLPGGVFSSRARDVSGDGTYIVGEADIVNVAGAEAFIWDSIHGIRNLREFLISDCGVTNLTGWTLSEAPAISADGQTIVGTGINPFGQTEAWRVTGVPGPLALNLGPSPHGSITGNASHYFPNTTAMLTAAPAPGYLFTGWTGDATGTANPLSVLMDADKTITANFAPDTNDDDDDGLTNYQEIVEHGTNPTLWDTDGDGVKDSKDAFPLDPAETLDTDHDGIGDNADPDDDGDGLSDVDEINLYGTNPKRADSDGDGITDPDELQVYQTNPLVADMDNDGLSDGAEVFTHHTDPTKPDTDGDGFLDGYEVLTGHLPLIATDKPALVAEARTAIEFTFPAELAKTYRIEASTDLAVWGTVESGIVGQGGQVQRFYSTRGMPRRYFRVEEESR